MTALRAKLAAAAKAQGDLLADIAVAELDAQKQRIADYEVQARFALATIYDRAAEAPRPAPAAAPGNTMRRQCTALLAAAMVIGSVASGAGKAPPPPTLKDLPKRQVEIRKDAPSDNNSGKAMDNYRKFLELRNADPALRAEALRRLGDLSLESGELDRMATEVTAVDPGGAEAIRLYTLLLQAHPDYPRNDQVLYQLARAYETTGQPDKALATLDEIVRRFPASRDIAEVHFRRGELLFPAQKYRDAQAAYAEVTRRGPGAYYQQGLYKQGWSLFKQNLNDDSLPVFAQLLDVKLRDAASASGFRPLDTLPRADREIVDDTLRVMSVVFSYEDGIEPLNRFVDRIGKPPYSALLYARLGDLYVEKQRYQDAAAAYRAFVAREPNNEFSPGLSTQAIEAYRKGGFAQLVLEGKREFVENYNLGSSFWQGRGPRQLSAGCRGNQGASHRSCGLSPCRGAEEPAGRRFRAGRALVSPAAAVLSAGSGIGADQFPAGRRAV